MLRRVVKGRGKRKPLYRRAPALFWPSIFGLALFSKTVVIYIYWFFRVTARLLLIATLATLLLSFIPVALTVAGVATLNLQASQEAWLGVATDVGEEAVSAAQFFVSLLQEIWLCKEPVIQFVNLVITIVLAAISRLTQAIALVFPGAPILFEWARAASAERMLLEVEVERHVASMRPLIDEEISAALKELPPDQHPMYIEYRLRKAYRDARRTVGANMTANQRFDILPDVLCDAIAELFGFLIDVLEIAADFIFGFLDLILDAWQAAGGQFDENFLFYFALYVLVAVLRVLPIAECFVDPDDLEGLTDPIEIFNVVFSQTVVRLFGCLCPWAYNGPLSDIIPCQFGSACNVYPEEFGTRLIKCFCFLPGQVPDVDDDPIEALLTCTGIDLIVDALLEAVAFVENVVLVIIDGLQIAVNWLINRFNDLRNAFEDLLDVVEGIEDALPRGSGICGMVDARDAIIEDICMTISGIAKKHPDESDLAELDQHCRALMAARQDSDRCHQAFDEMQRSAERMRAERRAAKGKEDIRLADIRSVSLKKLAMVGLRETRDALAQGRELITTWRARAATRAQLIYDTRYLNTTREERPSASKTSLSDLFLGVAMRMNSQARNISRTMRSPEAMARVRQQVFENVQKSPQFEALSNFGTHFSERYGPDGHKHAANIVRVARDFMGVVSWALAQPGFPSMSDLAVRMLDVPVERALASVRPLARVIRARHGGRTVEERSEPLRNMMSQGKMTVAALFGGSRAFVRTANRLRHHYGHNDTAIERAFTRVNDQWFSGEARSEDEEAPMGGEAIEKITAHARKELNVRREERERWRLGWFGVGKTAEGRWMHTKHQTGQEDEAWRQTVRQAWFAEYDRVIRYAHQQGETLSEDLARLSQGPANERIVVVISVVGGAAVSLVSIFGFALGAGLGFLATIGVALIVPIFFIIGLAFSFTIRLLVFTGVNILTDVFTDADRQFTFIVPYFDLIGDTVAASFSQGYQLSQLEDLLSESADITLENVFFVINFLIYDFSCKWPVRLGSWTCGAEPQVDPITGRPTQNPFEYLSDLLFADDRPCATPDDCIGGARCRGKIEPFNNDNICQRDCTKDAPCAIGNNPYGRCKPTFTIIEGTCIGDLDIEIDLTPRCQEDFDYPVSDIAYFNDPDFQEAVTTGGLRAWLRYARSSGFWSTSRAVQQSGIESYTWLLRRAFLGGYIKWSGLAAGGLSVMWFFPSPIARILAIGTILANWLTPIAQRTGIETIRLLDRNTDTWLIGGTAETLLRRVRFPNYEDFPPFGKPTVGDNLCFAVNLPAFLIVTAELFVLGMALFFFVSSGYPIFLIGFFIDVVLFPVNYILTLIITLWYTAAVYRQGVVPTSRAARRRAARGARAAGNAREKVGHGIFRQHVTTLRYVPETDAATSIGVSSVLRTHGIEPTSDHATIGNHAVYRITETDESHAPNQVGFWWSFVHAFENMLHGAVYHGVATRHYLANVWRHGPLRMRPAAERPAGIDAVVLTNALDSGHYGAFPYLRHIGSEDNQPLDGSDHHAVVSTDCLYAANRYSQNLYHYIRSDMDGYTSASAAA